MKTVFLFIGESGTGKTAVVDKLEELGYKVIYSYTTRKPRYENEKGHMFCTVEEYEDMKQNGDIVAYSLFDENHYFSTKDQMYECELYVVDPDGVTDLKSNIYDIKFITFYIYSSDSDRIDRMLSRGDSLEQIIKRVKNDSRKFKFKEYDYLIPNVELFKTVDIIEYIIKKEKGDV